MIGGIGRCDYMRSNSSNILNKWMKSREDYSQEDDAGLDLIDPLCSSALSYRTI